jgi:hypothetical protein
MVDEKQSLQKDMPYMVLLSGSVVQKHENSGQERDQSGMDYGVDQRLWLLIFGWLQFLLQLIFILPTRLTR